jgi:hypothetical protein
MTADTHRGLHRQVDYAPADHHGSGTAQIWCGNAQQEPEPAVEDDKSAGREQTENNPAERDSLPENAGVAEGFKPERLHVVGDRSARAQQQNHDDDK